MNQEVELYEHNKKYEIRAIPIDMLIGSTIVTKDLNLAKELYTHGYEVITKYSNKQCKIYIKKKRGE